MSKKYLLEILENNKPILQPTVASIQFLLSYSKAMDVKTNETPKGVFFYRKQNSKTVFVNSSGASA